MSQDFKSDDSYFWKRVGLLLLTLQTTEFVFARLQVFISNRDPFGEKEPDNAFAFYEALNKEGKKTLGQIIFDYRKSAETGEDVNLWLQCFLDDRNRFVHKFFVENDFQPESPNVNPEKLAFVEDLIVRAMHLQKTLTDVAKSWAIKHGLDFE